MLWKCDACKTLYAVDMPWCPQCGQTGHTEVDSGGEAVGPRFQAPGEPDKPAAETPADDAPVRADKPASARPAAGKAAPGA
jgi:hypothetical protein